MPSYFFLYIILIFCALGGLSLAAFIHFKKQMHHPIVCPIGHSCDPVVHSEYSRIMDIPVEILGVIYYTIIVVVYAATLAYPTLKSDILTLPILGLTTAAFLFSLYLTSVQAFILRQWCTWCLISASLCAVIFFLGFKLSGITLSSLISLLF